MTLGNVDITAIMNVTSEIAPERKREPNCIYCGCIDINKVTCYNKVWYCSGCKENTWRDNE